MFEMPDGRHVRRSFKGIGPDGRQRLAQAELYFYMGCPMRAEVAYWIAHRRCSGNARDRRRFRRRLAERQAFTTLFLIKMREQLPAAVTAWHKDSVAGQLLKGYAPSTPGL